MMTFQAYCSPESAGMGCGSIMVLKSQCSLSMLKLYLCWNLKQSFPNLNQVVLMPKPDHRHKSGCKPWSPVGHQCGVYIHHPPQPHSSAIINKCSTPEIHVEKWCKMDTQCWKVTPRGPDHLSGHDKLCCENLLWQNKPPTNTRHKLTIIPLFQG